MMLPGRARDELQDILKRAKVADPAASADGVESQCAALLARFPIEVQTPVTRAALRKKMPREIRRLARLPRGVESDHRLHYFAVWARYWLWQAGLRNAVSTRSHMACALQVLLDHATSEPKNASVLLIKIRDRPLLPSPAVVSVPVFLPGGTAI